MSGSAILAASKVWSQLCALVLLAMAARFLSMTDFGVFAIASALAMALNQWVGVGAFEYVIREADNDRAPSTAFWFNTAAGTAFAIVGMSIAAPMAGLFRAPDLLGLILILSPLAIPAGWRSVGESLLIRRNKLGHAGVAMLLQETLALTAAIGAFMSGLGVWSLALHKVVQFVVGPIVFLAAARWLPRFQFSRPDFDAMLRLGGPLTLDRLLSYVSGYGSDLILGLALSPAAVGVYRIGVRIITAAQFILYETLRARAWARLSNVAISARHNVAAAAERLVGQGWLLSTPAFAGLVLTADLIVRIALGPGWDESATVLRVLAIASVGQVVVTVMEPLSAINKRVSNMVALRICMVAVALPSMMFTAPYGPVAVAMSQAVVAVGYFLAALVMQQKLFSVRWHAGRIEALTAAGGVAAMALAVVTMRGAWAAAGLDNPIIEFALACAIGALAYGLSLLAVRRLFVPTLLGSWGVKRA